VSSRRVGTSRDGCAHAVGTIGPGPAATLESSAAKRRREGQPRVQAWWLRPQGRPDSTILALGGAAAVLFVGLLVFFSRFVRAPKLVFTPFGGRAPPSVPSAFRRPRRRLLVSPISLSSARQVAVASCASSKRAVARSIHGAPTLARNQNRRRHRLGTPRISLRLRPTFGRPRIEMPMAQLAQVSTTSKRLLLRAGGAARASSERVVRASRVGVALRWYLTGLILTTALCMFIAARN